jgi:hypothetical protein
MFDDSQIFKKIKILISGFKSLKTNFKMKKI